MSEVGAKKLVESLSKKSTITELHIGLLFFFDWKKITNDLSNVVCNSDYCELEVEGCKLIADEIIAKKSNIRILNMSYSLFFLFLILIQ